MWFRDSKTWDGPLRCLDSAASVCFKAFHIQAWLIHYFIPPQKVPVANLFSTARPLIILWVLSINGRLECCMGCRDEGGSSEFWEECEKCLLWDKTRGVPQQMKPKHGERTHAGAGIKNVVGLWLRVGVCVAVPEVQRSCFGISCVADTEETPRSVQPVRRIIFPPTLTCLFSCRGYRLKWRASWVARTLAGGLELDERNDRALCGRWTSQVHVVYVDIF